MMPNVQIVTLNANGREPAGEDHISALLLDEPPLPTWSGYSGEYRSLREVEADGIVEGDPTYAVAWLAARGFFKFNPSGRLRIFMQVSDTATIIAESGGKIRQFGAFGVPADLADFQALCIELAAQNAPAVCVYGVASSSPIPLNSLLDLRATGTYNMVSALIAGDGTAGAPATQLAAALGLPYIPAVGEVLGATAACKVSESPAHVERFDYSLNTDEFETTRLCSTDAAEFLPPSTLDGLHDKGYMLFRGFVGRSGKYLSDCPTATVGTSDFAYLNDNRTMQKVQRQMYAAYLPKLSAPIQLQADGKLSAASVAYWKSLGDKQLERMQRDGEISDFSITIDPAQNIAASSTLIISVSIVPIGIARNIAITLQFAV